MSASSQVPKETKHKTSYTISCPSAFRDRVLGVAEKKGVNAADLARTVILSVPEEIIAASEDPGEPEEEDREPVILQSGAHKGKPWRRKPRLQVRLPKGYSSTHLRKALNIALQLDNGDIRLTLEDAKSPTRNEEQQKLVQQIERFKSALDVAGGFLLPNAVRTRDEALFVMGFPPGSRPTAEAVKSRFRQLATIHHPDSETGDTQRMAQLNQAMSYMRGALKN